MESGKKYDAGKPDRTHVPKEAMYAMAEAFTYGAKKYIVKIAFNIFLF